MKYEYSKTLKDVVVVSPEIFYDYRGEYVETWNSESYEVFGDITWKQDDISMSVKGTLRGLHGDKTTWKLVQCLKGSILVAVVDMRVDSKTYLKSDMFAINERNRKQVLIPPGFANGHLALEDCIFSYKQSTLYQGQEAQFTVRWDDPAINLSWPIANPILSSRDKNAELIKRK